jgi:pimeloyl-ACP methyl ester carboxylesterase
MYTKSLHNITYIAGNDKIVPDAPTLILIHGAGQSALLWQHQVLDMDFQGNILAVDLPGHGDSTLAGCKRIEDYGYWIMELINTAQLNRVVLGGLSMGGAIVQHLLISAGDRFAAGLLINTGARLRVAPMFFEVLDTGESAWLDTSYRYSTFPANRSNELRNSFKRVSQCPIATTRTDFQACDQFDVTASLGQITCPVLVLSSEHDQLTPPKYGLFLADGIPNARLETIIDAGHLAPMEQPTAVNRAMAAFLNDTELQI